MRSILAAAAVLVGTFLVVPAATQTSSDGRPSDSLLRAFRAGGQVIMDLSAGEYRVSAGPDDSIRLFWSVRDRDKLDEVESRIDVRGSQANVDIDGPSGDNAGFHVLVEVPSRSDLHIRLTAGELDIRGITGNKDVRLHAGEMTIDVGRANEYRRVEASVWAGEVQASPFGRTTGGLFRSIDWEGPGQYRLEAHLKAGEIRLR